MSEGGRGGGSSQGTLFRIRRRDVSWTGSLVRSFLKMSRTDECWPGSLRGGGGRRSSRKLVEHRGGSLHVFRTIVRKGRKRLLGRNQTGGPRALLVHLQVNPGVIVYSGGEPTRGSETTTHRSPTHTCTHTQLSWSKSTLGPVVSGQELLWQIV